MSRVKQKCFVIMPFGEKTVGDVVIDFDAIWEDFLKPAAEAAEFQVERADTGRDHGQITSKMIRDIYEADVAIADVTYHNPNVFYELGIRHALCRHGTLLVKRTSGDLGVRRRDGSRKLFGRAPPAPTPEIPFDLKDIVRLEYDFSEASLPGQITALKGSIIARHKAAHSDSPVFSNIKDLRVTTVSGPASGRKDRIYDILDDHGERSGKRIGYRSGDVANLTLESGNHVDFWVNSENTLMQMARIYERAMSSTIRYLGARDPDPRSVTFDDTIQSELFKALGNDKQAAEEGDVLVTDSGRLRETHGVKAILHAAAVTGKPTKGFESISDERLADCIGSIISTARNEIRSGDPNRQGRSIIMPLFGTGQARRDSAIVASQLVYAAMEAVLSPAPDLVGNDIDLVLFSAFSEADVKTVRRVCETYLKEGSLAAP